MRLLSSPAFTHQKESSHPKTAAFQAKRSMKLPPLLIYEPLHDRHLPALPAILIDFVTITVAGDFVECLASIVTAPDRGRKSCYKGGAPRAVAR